MIKKGISVNKCNKKKQALYKIQKDSYEAEFPSLELVEVGKTKHHLVQSNILFQIQIWQRIRLLKIFQNFPGTFPR